MHTERGYFGHAIETGKALLTKIFMQHDSKEDNVTPLLTSEMAKRCLHIYLEPYKAIVQGKHEYPKHFKVELFVRQVRHIYHLHQEPMVQHPAAFPNVSKIPVPTLREVSFHRHIG